MCNYQDHLQSPINAYIMHWWTGSQCHTNPGNIYTVLDWTDWGETRTRFLFRGSSGDYFQCRLTKMNHGYKRMEKVKRLNTSVWLSVCRMVWPSKSQCWPSYAPKKPKFFATRGFLSYAARMKSQPAELKTFTMQKLYPLFWSATGIGIFFK